MHGYGRVFDISAARLVIYRVFARKSQTGRLGSGYTETQEVYFEPRGKRQFTGPVYYLQSGDTESAAEIFIWP
jgi:C-terminal processing protease CtpA/Prc